jgi:hypothetical protein
LRSASRLSHIEDMPVPIEFMRGVLGLLCIFFAHMAGRSGAAVHAGRQKRSGLLAWILRTVVCGGALLFRHEADTVAIGVYLFAAAAFAGGWWLAVRPRPEEDLTHEIFPEDR